MSTVDKSMNPPKGIPIVQTPWGRRARYCPDCETEIRWTGPYTGVCACNDGPDDARYRW
jgi:hypothetical protein